MYLSVLVLKHEQNCFSDTCILYVDEYFFISLDTVHGLTIALLLLNTDLHNDVSTLCVRVSDRLFQLNFQCC